MKTGYLNGGGLSVYFNIVSANGSDSVHFAGRLQQRRQAIAPSKHVFSFGVYSAEALRPFTCNGIAGYTP